MRRAHPVVLVALVALSCRRPEPVAPPVAPVPAAREAASSPVYRTSASTYGLDPGVTARGKTFMVVSEATDATRVGREVLAAGGNAVDATVAVAFALAVVHPSAGNLGGGGFAMVRTGPGKVRALDFREVAPAAATPDMFVAADGTVLADSLVGHRASGVPGSVAGLWELHRQHGKTPWQALLAPAIRLARGGFVLDQIQHASIVRWAARIGKFPASAAIWLPNGRPLATGTLVKIPELAAALERIAATGADGFYKGRTAALIVDEMRRGGGLITAKDLASYRVEWRDPLRFQYRGHTLAAMPPPSSGGVALAMIANILGRVDLGKLGWHSTAHVHWIVEAWRRAYAARNELLGDPAFVANPIAKLTSQTFADQLAATIGARATPSKDIPKLLEGTHTTNLVVVDPAGMAVALTTTINTSFGSGVTVTGAGFLLNNEMDDFTAKPGAPNTFGLIQGTANKIEPGKRMLSSMSPTIVEDAHGQLAMVVGAGFGGPRIITAVWQTISNVLDFGMPADVAVAAQRLHHQHLPDHVNTQAEAIDRPTAVALEQLGYTLDWSEPAGFFAAANAIVRTPAGWDGTADPRNAGAAMGD